MLAQPLNQHRWLPVVILMAGVTVLLWGQRDVVMSLGQKWFPQGTHSDYEHGGLLLLVAAVTAIVRYWRDERGFSIDPSMVGFGLLCIAGIVGLFADLVDVDVVRMLALLGMAMSLPWALLGWRGFVRLALPFGILLFAIPLWSVFHEPLRLLTAQLVGFLMNVSGVPTLVEGPNIRVPPGSFHVADNCTGLRQLVVAMPLAVIYSSLNEIKNRWMLFLVAAAAVVSVLTNMLRIYIVVMAGAMTNMQHYLVTEDHVTLGWILFASVMLGFFFVVEHFVKPANAARRPLILRESDLIETHSVSPMKAGLSALLVLVVVSIPVVVSRIDRSPELSSFDRDLLPEDISGWTRATAVEGADLSGYFPGADIKAEAVYREGRGVFLQTAYYASQRVGHEAVGWPNRPFHPELWQQVSWRRIDIHSAQGTIPVREDIVRSASGNERLVWSWYYVAGRHLSNPWAAKLMGALGTLQGDPAATCFVLTPLETRSPEEDRALLGAFIYEAAAALSQSLEKQDVVEVLPDRGVKDA